MLAKALEDNAALREKIAQIEAPSSGLKEKISEMVEEQERVQRINREREQQNQELEDKVKELMNEINHLTTFQSMTQSMASAGRDEQEETDSHDKQQYSSNQRLQDSIMAANYTY